MSCLDCPKSDQCGTCGKLDPADADMVRIKDFWTAIDRALAHVPTSIAVETRLSAAIGLQAAVRIGQGRLADLVSTSARESLKDPEPIGDTPLTPFLKKTNKECREWMEKFYVPEAIDRHFLVSLWAWQEQERRYAASAPVAPLEWPDFEKIRDSESVDECIRNLLEDQTGDNATCLVREVITQAGALPKTLHIQPGGSVVVEMTDGSLARSSDQTNWTPMASSEEFVRSGDPKDAARLVYACSGAFDYREFAGYVLNVGGVGDISDCRTFIDKKIGAPTVTRRPDETLPGLQPGQSWCCEKGCGECTPVQTEFVYRSTERPPGVVVEKEVGQVWVSGCCKADLMLWDEGKQDFVGIPAKEA